MAPSPMDVVSAATVELQKRYYCGYGYYYGTSGCRRSHWYWWGRWVLTGILIFAFFILLLLLTARNSRRRRTQGQPPMYGTGWMGKWGNGYNPQQQQQPLGQQNGGYMAPPPQYSQQAPVGAQYTGATYNSNEGYYGHYNQNTGNTAYGQPDGSIPLQQPATSYYPPNNRTAGDEYAPPPGPPPAKN